MALPPSDRRPSGGLTPGPLLALGLVVFIVGRIVDLIWHATHEEFETASDQLRAHAVVWLGALILLGASAGAVLKGTRNLGYPIVLAETISYAGVAAWHFWEHSQLRDPDLPHLLLAITNAVMLLGVVWVWVASRLPRRPEGTEPPRERR